MRHPDTMDIDRPISLVLLVGMVLSILCLLVGMVVLIAHPASHSSKLLPMGAALRDALRLHASGWLSLGVLVLILTPVARVVMAIFSFARIRDWRYAVISTIVLGAMITGLLLGV